MPIDVLGKNMFDIDKQYCPLCSALNYIRIDTLSIDGFRCWSCSTTHWIDDITLAAYMTLWSKTEQEANDDLRNSNPPVVVLEGRPEEEDVG